MSKLSIFDIVALAKAGYKAQDITQLTSVDIPEEGEKKEDPEDKKDEPASGSQPPAENPAEETGKDKEGDKDNEDNVDYKKLYEEKCAELEKAQKQNVHQPQPEQKPLSIDDIVRSFM